MKFTPKKLNVHGQRKDFALGAQCNLYSTDLRWGFALGVILGFALGVTQILTFLDTNMLVSPMRISGVGGFNQHKAPMWEFCFPVEYRLYITFESNPINTWLW